MRGRNEGPTTRSVTIPRGTYAVNPRMAANQGTARKALVSAAPSRANSLERPTGAYHIVHPFVNCIDSGLGPRRRSNAGARVSSMHTTQRPHQALHLLAWPTRPSAA